MSTLQGIGVIKPRVSNTSQRIHISWTIENFRVRYKNLNEYLTSPVFSTMYLDNVIRWQMRFCPRNPVQKYQNYSSVFLDYLNEENDDKVNVSIQFCMFDFEEKISVNGTNLGQHVFQSTKKSYGSNRFVDITNALLQKDKLKIVCSILSAEPLIFPKTVYDAVNDQPTIKDYRLEDDLGKLFENVMLADVTVSIGRTKKLLHKVILASRSEVFRAMLEHDMVEKKTNVIQIVDIRLEVAMEMFRYMYTGKVKDIEKMADELLMAAEKYAIMGLKIICEKTLQSNLNFENALRYLQLADMYNTSDLKAQAIELITANSKNFVDKPEFNSLDRSILCQLYSALAKK